jgi:hypothetical protein
MSDKEESKKESTSSSSFSNISITNSKGTNMVGRDSNNVNSKKTSVVLSVFAVLVLGGAALAFVLGVNNGGQSPKSEQEKQIPKNSPTPSKPTSTPSKPN